MYIDFYKQFNKLDIGNILFLYSFIKYFHEYYLEYHKINKNNTKHLTKKIKDILNLKKIGL